MTRRLVPALALALACLALACSPRRLPGTEINETPDTLAIADLIEAYRKAVEARDVPAILAMVAPNYYDTAGTPDPSDDVDRAGLERRLTQDFAALETIRLGITLRRIDVQGDSALAESFFDSWYRVKTPNGVVPRRDSDVHRMKLQRIEKRWLFTSGL